MHFSPIFTTALEPRARFSAFSLIAIIVMLTFTTSGCSFRRITRTKNVVYMPRQTPAGHGDQQLNIFAPRRNKTLRDVIVFIHGGNWNSGRKEQYNIIGKHWAKKGIVYVIIDYPLSPRANFRDMAIASAASVKWVKENISKYGGNPDRIFVSGHSAGGHLASLISVDDHYFRDLEVENPIAGTILIDAGGLDMYGYLMDEKPSKDDTYFKTFTGSPENWKEASPLHHLHQKMPSMVLYQGGKTYPSIVKSTAKFIKALDEFAPGTPFRIQKSKKHVPMITQFFNPWNRRYREMIRFMQDVKADSVKNNSAADRIR